MKGIYLDKNRFILTNSVTPCLHIKPIFAYSDYNNNACSSIILMMTNIVIYNYEIIMQMYDTFQCHCY